MAKKWTITLVILGLLTITLVPRLTDLGKFLTADEKRWQANVSGFVTNLAHGELGHLVQQPHPGITTQWLAAPTIFSEDWGIRKISLAVSQGILVLLIGYIFWRLWGGWAGLTVTLLLALSPTLIAHTRVLAMDSLLALFTALSLGLLLLWRKTEEWHYLSLAAGAAAAAWLSKLPGIALLPFTLAVLFSWHLFPHKNWSKLFRNSGLWLISFALAAALILPSLALNPASVIGDFLEFFRSDDYQSLHPAGHLYYLGTIIFFATPLNLLGLVALIMSFSLRRFSKVKREELIILSIFALLFVVQMSLGAKKGDRYILPSLTLFDIVTAGALLNLASHWWQQNKIGWSKITASLLVIGLIWQGVLIWQLHPYTLAYVNPLTKPWLNERRLGWGEGLDLAAEYLNQKPNAENLKVASFYPNEFAYNFRGGTVPIHQWDTGSPDYVVTYRAMYERGAEAWETDVLQQLAAYTPEKTIELGGIPYLWIYHLSDSESD